MPPTVPINHYFGPRNQQNKTKVLFHYSMLMYSSEIACFEHSNFFKVNVSSTSESRNPFKGTGCLRETKDLSPACSTKTISQPLSKLQGLRPQRFKKKAPKFNYELFNCNNFNIRYWSWNYRGCWPSEFSHSFILPILPSAFPHLTCHIFAKTTCAN